MNILFVVSSSDVGFWLAQLTHPFWHFSERGNRVHFASPAGGKVEWDRLSDPYSPGSWEAQDLVSRGFLSNAAPVARLESTLAPDNVVPEHYDAALTLSYPTFGHEVPTIDQFLAAVETRQETQLRRA